MKDKNTRRSKGVAFIMFLRKEDAQTCTKAVNGREDEVLYDSSDEDYRTPPKQSKQVQKQKLENEKEEEDGINEEEEYLEPDLETLSAVIKLEQEKVELDKYRYKVATGEYEEDQEEINTKPKKRIRPNSYFSDEEDVSD
ncbi:Zinc finger CCHC-type and RNA-binding motif-containing protein 1 [Blattella germanica]|nr:Zinc finger CCHC-type and RNA-binding motif-containing protein 1 [Blattella germanica]